MPSLSCDWRTVESWAELMGVDPDFFDLSMPMGGTTYVRRCDDGTIYLNADFAYAVRDA